MAKTSFPTSKILSTAQFLRSYQTGMKNNERFCFILGSGASVESGIPMGGSLENRWMACLMGEEQDLDGTPPFQAEGTRKLAKLLHEEGKLQFEFKEIENAWKKIKKEGRGTLPSKYYFDLYKIRFYPNHRNGYYYLERLMANAEPSFGYHPLAQMLSDGHGNNLVITTNFDNLIEDALFLYTEQKPLVINHELLTDYIGSNLRRPIVAKVHRGMFFDPLNDPAETLGLKGKWHEVLEHAFQIYTPVVIGYGGGDHSLMDFLKEEKTRMQNGIYWCYMEEYGLPEEDIQSLVGGNNGWFVQTRGFDSFMLAVGNELYPEKISIHETERYLSTKNSARIKKYQDTVNALTAQKAAEPEINCDNAGIRKVDETLAAELIELKKFRERESAAQKKREDESQMTAWDYKRKGDECYKAEQWEEAVRLFTEAIKLQPETALFYNDRGCSYDSLKKWEEAIADFTKAIELNPDYTEAYNNRGYIYIGLGELEKALTDVNKAIKINPQNSEAYNNRGSIYEDMGRSEEALTDYSKAIEINPPYGAAYSNRGYSYKRIGLHKEAIADLLKAIELEPDFANPYNHLGNIYEEQKNYKLALENYTHAIGLNKEYAEAYEGRARVYRSLGRLEEAEADEKRAQELKRKDND